MGLMNSFIIFCVIVLYHCYFYFLSASRNPFKLTPHSFDVIPLVFELFLYVWNRKMFQVHLQLPFSSALESASSPKSLCPFQWAVILRNQELVTRCSCCQLLRCPHLQALPMDRDKEMYIQLVLSSYLQFYFTSIATRFLLIFLYFLFVFSVSYSENPDS